jgi:hypothetical protein
MYVLYITQNQDGDAKRVCTSVCVRLRESCRLALKFDAKCIGTFRPCIKNTMEAHPGAVGKVVRAAVEINLSRSLFSGESERERKCEL